MLRIHLGLDSRYKINHVEGMRGTQTAVRHSLCVYVRACILRWHFTIHNHTVWWITGFFWTGPSKGAVLHFIHPHSRETQKTKNNLPTCSWLHTDARTPERWSELFSSCPRNVRLLDEKHFWLTETWCWRGGDLMPDSWSSKERKEKVFEWALIYSR